MNLAAVLLFATLLGQERPVAPPAYGPAFGTQQPNALVSDGKDFLAVWTGIDGIYAAAVDENGAARPTPPHVLFQGYVPRAAWAGDAYVLVWQDSGNTWTARMNRDAQLVSEPVVVAANTGPLAIGSYGGRTLIVLSGFEGVSAILIGPDSEVLRKDIAIPAAARIFAASVAAGSEGFMVASVETTFAGTPRTVVRATRFLPDGALDRARVLAEVPNNVNSIDAAVDGGRVGVAFVARRSTANETQLLHTFTIEAGTLASTEHPRRIVEGDDPQVVRTPDGFAAGLLEGRARAPLALITIPFGADERRATLLGSNTPGADLHMATNGTKVLSVWRDFRFSPSFEYSTVNLFGLALDAAAAQAQSDVVPVAISAVAQGQPSIASAGTSSLVAWMDMTKTVHGNVMVRRVDARGNPLDAVPMAIVADVPAQQRPVVAFTGEVWVVAWYVVLNADGQSRAYMRRVSRSGALLDATPIDLGPGRVSAAASNGTVTLLALGKSLLRLSAAGERLGTVALPEAEWSRGLASNGQEFLLVWDEGSDWWQFPSPNMRDVRAIRLDASGNPMDAAPIDIAMSPANEVDPIAASDGTDFLVVYGHGSDERTIRAKRVLRTGVLADHTALATGSLVGTGEFSYALAPHQGGYLAVFARPLAWAAAIDAVPLDARGAAVEEPVTLAITRWLGGLMPGTAIAGTTAVYSRSDESLANIERVFVRPVGAEPGRRRTIRK